MSSIRKHCTVCGSTKIKCKAKLKGKVSGWFRLRVDAELMVFLVCLNCDATDQILHEAQGGRV